MNTAEGEGKIISKIKALIEESQITTLVTPNQLDITEAADVVRDWFIMKLKDLLEEYEKRKRAAELHNEIEEWTEYWKDKK